MVVKAENQSGHWTTLTLLWTMGTSASCSGRLRRWALMKLGLASATMFS
jgi:hypothetical protein